MAKSIMQPEEEKVCYITGSQYNLDCHHQHIMGGPNRKLSEKYGLKVWLRHDIHMDLHDRDNDLKIQLKQEAQKVFEEKYSHELWMQLFRKNYL